MDSIWFKFYCAVGVAAMIAVVVFRLFRRQSESTGRDDWLFTVMLGSEWILALTAVFLWPLFLPLLVWSLRARRKQKWVRHDQNE
jgi:hypothetical protein